MADRKISPAILDAVINGVKVYIYKRNDGTHYPSLDDYTRLFGSNPHYAPVEEFRVPVHPFLAADFTTWPEVIEKMEAYGSN